MFHHHQSSSTLPPYFPPQPHIVNANPSSFPSFPRPLLPPGVASEPALHPPGTDPYSNSALLPSNYVGLEGHSQYYADPIAGSHNWVIPLAEPVGYAFKSLHENQVTSTSYDSFFHGHRATQSLEHDTTRIKQMKIKSTQPVRCEVCKIDCNSKDVFDKHVIGKKHKKNLEMQNSSLTGSTSSGSNKNMLSQMGNVSGEVVQGTSDVPACKDLETKKRKLLDCGTKSDSARVCTVCNVVCNSQEVFNKHLSGKKHAAQAGLISQNPCVAAIRPRYDSSSKKKPKKNRVVQSAWCEVCKINCNSSDIYANHLSGKKHLKNIEKLEKGKSDAGASEAQPSTTDAIIGPVENPAANNPSNDDVQKTQKSSAQAPEDLETKKRKIMESGTAADSVRTCSICNVVCNSQTVFNSHLAGQKHAAMVKKKQAVSGMPMLLGHPLVTALPN